MIESQFHSGNSGFGTLLPGLLPCLKMGGYRLLMFPYCEIQGGFFFQERVKNDLFVKLLALPPRSMMNS